MLLFCSCVQNLNMANFEMLEGRRKNSKVYIYQQYRYTVCNTYKDYKRLRCVEYKHYLCSGAATLKGNVVTLVKEHNHATDDSEIREMKVKAQLKKAVGEMDEEVHTIYHTIMAKYPDEVKMRLPWKSVRSGLYALRKTRPSRVAAADASNNRCDVCLLPAAETWGFDPCGHYPFCCECSNIIVRNDKKCPICRKAVLKRTRLFHT